MYAGVHTARAASAGRKGKMLTLLGMWTVMYLAWVLFIWEWLFRRPV
jgi:hypothetical protein